MVQIGINRLERKHFKSCKHKKTGDMYVFINPFRTSRMRHKVSFLAEFNNLETSVLLLLDWLSNQGAKEPSLPNNLPIARGRIIGYIPFLCCGKCCQPRLGFGLASPCLFSTTVSITPRVPGVI